MRKFVLHLSADVRSGRESWRVFIAAGSISLVVAALNVAMRAPQL